MNGPKTKGGLRKTVRQIEDEFGVDKTVEDIVDGILSIFDNDEDEEEEEESSDSIFDSDSSDDSDSGDFGDGDFGGGGSDDDW
jgi:hypothetical protein